MNNYVEAKPVASYKHLDSEWYKTAEGDACVQQLFSAQNQCRKQFGLLERPSLSPGTPEVVYKIGILGKAGSGKTKTIALLSGKPFNPSGYAETCGIRVHDCYWPARIRERVCLFKLQFWDSGESCSKKFSYISTVCVEKSNALAVVINKADRSTLEFAESKLGAITQSGKACLIFVIDAADQEMQVQDEDLTQLARRRRLPIFHLPSHTLDMKYLAPFFNSLCDFLYSSQLEGAFTEVVI